jgi:hypothetical protein
MHAAKGRPRKRGALPNRGSGEGGSTSTNAERQTRSAREIFLRRLVRINRIQSLSREETTIIETGIETYLPGLWVAN